MRPALRPLVALLDGGGQPPVMPARASTNTQGHDRHGWSGP